MVKKRMSARNLYRNTGVVGSPGIQSIFQHLTIVCIVNTYSTILLMFSLHLLYTGYMTISHAPWHPCLPFFCNRINCQIPQSNISLIYSQHSAPSSVCVICVAHYSFSRSKYFRLLIAPIYRFISLIG